MCRSPCLHPHPFDDFGGSAEHIIEHHEGRLDIIREAQPNLSNGTFTDLMRILFRRRSLGKTVESGADAHSNISENSASWTGSSRVASPATHLRAEAVLQVPVDSSGASRGRLLSHLAATAMPQRPRWPRLRTCTVDAAWVAKGF
jgi:hypothetical protein